MTPVTERTAISVAVEMTCRDRTVTLDVCDREGRGGYQPVGKTWRTLRRGDLVRDRDGYEFTVRKVTLRKASPPLSGPVEIESVVAWAATGLRR